MIKKVKSRDKSLKFVVKIKSVTETIKNCTTKIDNYAWLYCEYWKNELTKNEKKNF